MSAYPQTRMRRLRRHDWTRRLVAENILSPADFIWPVFVIEGENRREPVEVTVALAADPEAFCAVFTDTGDPALLDLSSVEMPDELAESGRGLAIALATLDELVHETGEGNTWRLRRRHRGA